MSRYLPSHVAILLLAVASISIANPPVALELVTEPGFPIDGQQRWLQFVQSLNNGFSTVRIRSARVDDQPKIENRGSEATPRYAVTGILLQTGRLALPGVTVRYGQRDELASWLDKLRRGGSETVTAPTVAFGLTERQLTTLKLNMRKRLILSTKNRPLGELVRHLQQTFDVKLDVDASAQRAIVTNEEVLDELQGLACGTALAAAVRPYGLLVVPSGQGTRSVGLKITRDAKEQEAWPIGAVARSGVQGLAPELLKFVPVEVVDQPLGQTLDAIQQRLKLPFLYDHNALARHEVNLDDRVNLALTKTFYKKVIDKLLFQKLLRCELRTDEVGTPFLWITSAKR